MKGNLKKRNNYTLGQAWLGFTTTHLFGYSMQQAVPEGQCRAYDLTKKFGRHCGISQCKHSVRHCSAAASIDALSQIVRMLLSLPEMSFVVDMDCSFRNIVVNLNHRVALGIPAACLKEAKLLGGEERRRGGAPLAHCMPLRVSYPAGERGRRTRRGC